MGGWRPSLGAHSVDLGLGQEAEPGALRRAERALGVELSPELRDLLTETDGVSRPGGGWVVWPADRIVSENLAMRADDELAGRCMPFDALLFFGEAADGDRFANPIRGGRAGTDVFRWEASTDSRSKVAAGLEQYIADEVAPGFALDDAPVVAVASEAEPDLEVEPEPEPALPPLPSRGPAAERAGAEPADEGDPAADDDPGGERGGAGAATGIAAAAAGVPIAARLTAYDMEVPADAVADPPRVGVTPPPARSSPPEAVTDPPAGEPEPEPEPQPESEPWPPMVTATDMPYGSGPVESSTPNRTPLIAAAAAIAVVLVVVIGVAIAMTRGGDSQQTASRAPATAAPTTTARKAPTAVANNPSTTAAPSTTSTTAATNGGTSDTTDTTASTETTDTTSADETTSTTAASTSSTAGTGTGGTNAGRGPTAVPVTTAIATTTTIPPAIIVASPSSGTHHIPKGGSMQMVFQNAGATPGSFVLWSDGVTTISQSAGTLGPGAVTTITIKAAPRAEGASQIRGALEGVGAFGFTVFIDNGAGGD